MKRTRDFKILYTPWLRPLFGILALGPALSEVILTDDYLSVRMGWAFRVRIPRSSIRSARRAGNAWWAIGAHTNLRGAWLVNDSARNVVRLDIDPPVAGRSAGLPTRVTALGLSLEDPDGFLAALG
jgi:hypothetical protein